MEHLIATFLFQYKYCPLPAIGKLSLTEKPALVAHGAKLIDPPQPVITLVQGEFDTDDFLAYISHVERIEKEEAQSRLQRFCKQLQGLDSYAETRIPNTGKFYVNAEGNLVFRHSTFPTIFQDSVPAEKVIHPDASHTLLVGDKESSTSQMTEYYNIEEPVPQKKWWIAVIVLALTALLIIFFYYSNNPNTGMFGNTAKPALQEEPQTYTTPK